MLDDSEDDDYQSFQKRIVERLVNSGLIKEGNVNIVFIKEFIVTKETVSFKDSPGATYSGRDSIFINNTISNISKLRQKGEADGADAIDGIAAALSASDIPEEDKQGFLKKLDCFSDEAVKNDDQQDKSIMKSMFNNLDKALPAIEGVAKVWDSFKDTLSGMCS